MSTHENFQEQEAVQGSSDKGFGLTIAVALAIFALARMYLVDTLDLVSLILLACSVLFFLLSFVKPEMLRPLNHLWFKLGMILFKIINPVVLFLIYALTIFPIGVFLRLSGKDPLHLEWNKDIGTYWSERNENETETSMKNQF